MHDSFTPLGGMIPLVNVMLGEVIFGGVGSGLYGMLVFVILAVFIAGLMVGRTPEYLGKKVEAFDVKMAMLSVLVTSVTILTLAAIAVVAKFGTFEHFESRPAWSLADCLCVLSTGTTASASRLTDRLVHARARCPSAGAYETMRAGIRNARGAELGDDRDGREC